jgi:hypothetical protein
MGERPNPRVVYIEEEILILGCNQLLMRPLRGKKWVEALLGDLDPIGYSCLSDICLRFLPKAY